MDIVNKLKNFGSLVTELKYLQSKIGLVHDKHSSGIVSGYLGLVEANIGVGDKVYKPVAASLDLIDLYISKSQSLVDEIREIEEAIELLDPIERLIIRAKYIDGETLESISCMIGYGYRHTKRMHAIAISKLEQLE